MKVHILDKELVYENNISVIRKMFEDINNIISSSGYILSHLVIDRIEIYENHHQVIDENIERINNIEVVLISMNDLLKNNLNGIKNLIINMNNKVMEIAKKYYTNKVDNHEDIINIIEGIMHVKKTIELINSEVGIENMNDIDSSLRVIEDVFKIIEKYMVKGDNIRIGDLFINDMKLNLATLSNEINKVKISM